jgi:hypothetical protein
LRKFPRHLLAPEVQNADQGEQTARSIDIDLGFAFKAFLQDAGAFVVDTATGHIDCLDLAGASFSQRQSSWHKSGSSL